MGNCLYCCEKKVVFILPDDNIELNDDIKSTDNITTINTTNTSLSQSFDTVSTEDEDLLDLK